MGQSGRGGPTTSLPKLSKSHHRESHGATHAHSHSHHRERHRHHSKGAQSQSTSISSPKAKAMGGEKASTRERVHAHAAPTLPTHHSHGHGHPTVNTNTGHHTNVELPSLVHPNSNSKSLGHNRRLSRERVSKPIRVHSHLNGLNSNALKKDSERDTAKYVHGHLFHANAHSKSGDRRRASKLQSKLQSKARDRGHPNSRSRSYLRDSGSGSAHSRRGGELAKVTSAG